MGIRIVTATVTDSMKGYDSDMDQLQHRTELENKRANPNQDSTTATVTWFGYEAPQLGWDLIGANSVADDHAARDHGQARPLDAARKTLSGDGQGGRREHRGDDGAGAREAQP